MNKLKRAKQHRKALSFRRNHNLLSERDLNLNDMIGMANVEKAMIEGYQRPEDFQYHTLDELKKLTKTAEQNYTRAIKYVTKQIKQYEQQGTHPNWYHITG